MNVTVMTLDGFFLADYERMQKRITEMLRLAGGDE